MMYEVMLYMKPYSGCYLSIENSSGFNRLDDAVAFHRRLCMKALEDAGKITSHITIAEVYEDGGSKIILTTVI